MYTNSRIDDSSYEDIKELYFLSFGLSSTVEEIRKKYDTTFFGLKNVGVIAKDENHKPTAYYGVFPITLEYKGADYLVAQSGDTMTAPDHRKRGLFETLAKECYAMAEQLGVRMVFGFPNENSFPGFQKKLNWYFTGVMKRFTIKGSNIPLCELSAKYRFLSGFYKWYVRLRLSKYIIDVNDENIQCFRFSKVPGQVKRDVNFFNYKLNRDSIALIKLNGITLFIKYNPHLFIGDVGYLEKSQTSHLISTIKKLSKILGCSKIIFYLSENHWLFEYLKDSIEPTDSLPIGFYQIDTSLIPEEIQFTMADYDTF